MVSRLIEFSNLSEFFSYHVRFKRRFQNHNCVRTCYVQCGAYPINHEITMKWWWIITRKGKKNICRIIYWQFEFGLIQSRRKTRSTFEAYRIWILPLVQYFVISKSHHFHHKWFSIQQDLRWIIFHENFFMGRIKANLINKNAKSNITHRKWLISAKNRTTLIFSRKRQTLFNDKTWYFTNQDFLIWDF